jgi:glutaredoxin
MYYVIGKDNCSWCDKAKRMLEKDHTAYVYKNLSTMTESKQEMYKRFIKEELSMTTVPVIFQMIGTSLDLEDHLNE